MTVAAAARPLRIALLGSSRFPIAQPFAGGLEAHVWHLAHALTERGHRVTLFGAEGTSTDVAHDVIDVHTFQMSPHARTEHMGPSWVVHEHHAYLSVMLELAGPLAQSFDVIHNHSLHYLPIAMSSMVPVPMLTTLHTPPLAWLESAAAVPLNPNTGYAAVSEYTAQQWLPVAGPIPVVPNGIPLDRWPFGQGTGDRGGAGEYAVWTGRLVPEKGVDLAIDAARRAGYHLRIAGPAADDDYFRTAVEPRLGDGVTYEGHLMQKELADLVGGAAVALVTPQWDEPYGLVVAEALACGTPVAAFRRGGIPEILDDTCGRMVPADDIDALAGAIGDAARLPRAHARARAERICSDATMVDSYLDLYRVLLTTSGRTAAVPA
ncbi:MULTISPECIES: glycosyltransferase [unclassified Rhodococcus (in: high G+C Gram-positive bacteria)]|uniref:glycosyltransferase n=1 Tax=unclassified Rhodococcus (in: high G+C Gram-positive bacteria) TaxID=192944 RepID=UPI0006F4522E|nr:MULTISPECIES: glycosyltransferase [unclassified Rhodococcus (in: high G+C Gram-positive bacteria)]KQU36344.1 glycosyl transferase family 1 [Rhodococcus sp. Leaf225]KQU48891.1 glycosyl transferase family 1 [Rhodococcus sp. Leaf258]